jgi:putative transposase
VHLVMDIGEAPALQPASNPIGIDVGIKTFATCSDGSVFENPKFLKEASEQIKKLQRKVSSKKKGSNRRRKAKHRLSREHQKLVNRRKNFARHLASKLVAKYNGFAVERLSIASMLEDGSKSLNRSIQDAAWSNFLGCLRSKAEEAGYEFKEIDPKGTSQVCSKCGSWVEKDLSIREHDCPDCGLKIDRDLNAARNIYDLGRRSAGDFSCGGFS